MLIESHAFWPAGSMTITQMRCSVSPSTSPVDGNVAVPPYGTAIEERDLRVVEHEEAGTPEAPDDGEVRIVDDKSVDVKEEVRKPRVGTRPVLPTKAQIAEH